MENSDTRKEFIDNLGILTNGQIKSELTDILLDEFGYVHLRNGRTPGNLGVLMKDNIEVQFFGPKEFDIDISVPIKLSEGDSAREIRKNMIYIPENFDWKNYKEISCGMFAYPGIYIEYSPEISCFENARLIDKTVEEGKVFFTLQDELLPFYRLRR